MFVAPLDPAGWMLTTPGPLTVCEPAPTVPLAGGTNQ